MGEFITFEGIEGCGKSTQIRLLAKRLETDGHRVVLTREPGGCPIADQIRAILLDAGNRAMVPTTELLLYAAARAQHVEEVIRPALAEGAVVLCDRFTDATTAYQGHGRQLDLPLITELNRLATGGVAPSLTVLLDCPVATGLQRAMARINGSQGAREERFELESRAFHERVRQGYLQLAAVDPQRFLVVDADREIDAIEAELAERVMARLQGG